MTVDKTEHFTTPIVLSSPVSELLASWAEDGYPHETCGLLLGRTGDESIDALWTTWSDNLDRDRPRDRYILDPASFVTADRQARTLGLEIVGVWHTHPDHPAEPSRTDLEAAWEGYSYLILSISASGVESLRCWRLQGSRFVEQMVQREENPS